MSEPKTIAEALASLPEEERIVLSMYYIKSMEPSAIAAMLKVPEKSIQVVIATGRARIASLLGL